MDRGEGGVESRGEGPGREEDEMWSGECALS